MAVGMLMAGNGVTRDSYVRVTEEMFGEYPMRPEQSPPGLLVHTAGEGEQGWYVYDIWESKDDFGRFVETQLQPAMERVMAEMGGGNGGARPEPVFFGIETLVRSA